MLRNVEKSHWGRLSNEMNKEDYAIDENKRNCDAIAIGYFSNVVSIFKWFSKTKLKPKEYRFDNFLYFIITILPS